jgi:hypothetical protein
LEDVTHRQAIEVRQHDVQQDYVRHFRSCQAQPLSPVFGANGVAALFAQVEFQQFQELWFVVNNELRIGKLADAGEKARRAAMRVARAVAEWHTYHVSTKLIEQQLSALERRIASLEAAVKRRPRDSWKQIIGVSRGQKLDREAARLGASWRMKENKRR